MEHCRTLIVRWHTDISPCKVTDTELLRHGSRALGANEAQPPLPAVQSWATGTFSLGFLVADRQVMDDHMDRSWGHEEPRALGSMIF